MITPQNKISEIVLPTQEDAVTSYKLALSSKQQSTRNLLETIVLHPPQVLIFEGSSMNERLSMALWWSALLNCQKKTPCLTCPTCLQIGAHLFYDLFLLKGNEDGIKIDDIRKVRSTIAEPPHGNGKKVVLFVEAQYMRIEASNALLKSFEEPHPEVCFILLVPQREQLLSTIISRAWTITLPWNASNTLSTEIDGTQWEEKIATFISTGKDWFNQTSDKHLIDPTLVRQLIVSIRKALINALTKQNKNVLSDCLAILPEAGILHIQDLLIQTEEALSLMVNPSLVLHRLVTQMFLAYQKAKLRSLC